MNYKEVFGVEFEGKIDWIAVQIYVVVALLILDLALNVFRV